MFTLNKSKKFKVYSCIHWLKIVLAPGSMKTVVPDFKMPLQSEGITVRERRQSSLTSQEGTTKQQPTCSCTCHMPSYLSFVKSFKAVVDSKHFVALSDSHSDSRAHGGVHTCCRCTHVHHRHVKRALWVTNSSSHTHTHTHIIYSHKGESKTLALVLIRAICFTRPKLHHILKYLHTR